MDIVVLQRNLDERIESFRKETKAYGSYTSLRKQISEQKRKLAKKPELRDDSQFKLEFERLESHLQVIHHAEREIFLIQDKVKKEVRKINRKKNLNELKALKRKNKKDKYNNYMTIRSAHTYKSEQISGLRKEMEDFSNKLKKYPKNLAFKVDYFDKKRKLNDITKKIAKAHFKKELNLSRKVSILKSKIVSFEKKAEKYALEINEYKDIYELARRELTKNKNLDSDKSFIVENLSVFYGKKQALYDVSIQFPKNKVISIIGPSGCGKSTFLRTLNRINDEINNFRVKGRILLDGEYDIYKLKSIRNNFDRIELTELRTKVGMIFQQPNPFPISIFKNVSYGPRINGHKNKVYLNNLVKQSLIKAALWDEVKDNIHRIGTSLSGGQQQRLCIARAIANKPEILLMDEPTSALDPIAASKIESLILELKKDYTIIMVTHSMQQAARISDYTAFFYNGKIVEFSETKKLFSAPKRKKTDDYIRGRFG